MAGDFKILFVADKKSLFLKLAKPEKLEFTGVNDRFESGRDEKKCRSPANIR